MASKALSKVLTTPSKVASALDWRKAAGSVLSLDIHKDRIGLAVSSHPSYGEDSIVTFEPIKLVNKKGKVSPECKEKLSQLVKDHKVCGFVVSFPLQQDTGRMGAACGRVLHTLDDLLLDTSIVTPSRPLCLWDALHSTPEQEDEWGRCSAYSRTSDKTVHVASQEQYNQDENIVAAQVWDDFCKVNWPGLYNNNKKKQHAATDITPKQTTSTETTTYANLSDSLENEHWDDSASYVKVAAL